jgi:hypothetical protein
MPLVAKGSERAIDVCLRIWCYHVQSTRHTRELSHTGAHVGRTVTGYQFLLIQSHKSDDAHRSLNGLRAIIGVL